MASLSGLRAEGKGLGAAGKGQNSHAARPLLKWAGGKRQLLPALRRFYPSSFNRYWEPFLGSGAVFFDLQAQGLLNGHASVLSDSNADLIACYTEVRDRPREVIEELSGLAREHQQHGSTHFYAVRDERFNPQRQALTALAGALPYTPSLAAMFIYLNRTGYNGLFRLNADGAFNVPAGRYANPRICDADNLHRVSKALQSPDVRLVVQRFDQVVFDVEPGDFVYFDPPYAPLSKTARFTSYTAGGFNGGDQVLLRDVGIALARGGCHIVISNSTAPEIAELYEHSKDVSAAALRCYKVPARRAINSNAGRRGNIDEYIITNVG